QALITGAGRPGPGTSAAGVTVPVDGGSAAADAPAEGLADCVSGETGTGLVAPGLLALGAPGGEAGEGAGGLLSEPGVFFMVVMKNNPTTTTSTPITLIWTTGLSLSAFLMRPPARSRSRAVLWRRASA